MSFDTRRLTFASVSRRDERSGVSDELVVRRKISDAAPYPNEAASPVVRLDVNKATETMSWTFTSVMKQSTNAR